MKRPPLLALLGLVVACLACGGGGGGGGGPTAPPPPPPPPSGVSFTAGSAGANSVSMRSAASSTANLLDLEIFANSVENLFGVAFDVLFPANLLDFDGGTEGGVLDQGTAQTSFVVTEAEPGRLVVALSRLGPTALGNAQGVLLTLSFSRSANGSGPIDFDNESAQDETGTELAAVTWVGGTVQINP